MEENDYLCSKKYRVKIRHDRNHCKAFFRVWPHDRYAFALTLSAAILRVSSAAGGLQRRFLKRSSSEIEAYHYRRHSMPPPRPHWLLPYSIITRKISEKMSNAPPYPSLVATSLKSLMKKWLKSSDKRLGNIACSEALESRWTHRETELWCLSEIGSGAAVT